ncbi:hypothetical protein FOL47_004763 [Perkinsus chesapeaki]|uniref:Uncharacterized protein n=1 Tax=Perkinsus chesapeaki TaxID=330153 RepID=A0A7J6MYX3_PERCH|nr:hypothetical protein FOL47_004763 [Perkinsus chesapeaki]
MAHSSAVIAGGFELQRALALSTGTNVRKRQGYKEWKNRMRRHRAYLSVVESYLSRELRLLRQVTRGTMRYDPFASVGLISEAQLPDLVASEKARKASDKLREHLSIEPRAPVTLPPIRETTPIRDAEISACSELKLESLVPTQMSCYEELDPTPRLVKCTPRRNRFRKPSTAVGSTTLVLQSGDITTSMGTESSLVAYASTMSEGWTTSSILIEAPPVRLPPKPRPKKVSPRRQRAKRSVSVQTEAVNEEEEETDVCMVRKALLRRVYCRSLRNVADRECQLQTSAITVQRAYRTLARARREQKRRNDASIIIQRRYRAFAQARREWENSPAVQAAAALIQKQYRSLRMSTADLVIELLKSTQKRAYGTIQRREMARSKASIKERGDARRHREHKAKTLPPQPPRTTAPLQRTYTVEHEKAAIKIQSFLSRRQTKGLTLRGL